MRQARAGYYLIAIVVVIAIIALWVKAQKGPLRKELWLGAVPRNTAKGFTVNGVSPGDSLASLKNRLPEGCQIKTTESAGAIYDAITQTTLEIRYSNDQIFEVEALDNGKLEYDGKAIAGISWTQKAIEDLQPVGFNRSHSTNYTYTDRKGNTVATVALEGGRVESIFLQGK